MAFIEVPVVMNEGGKYAATGIKDTPCRSRSKFKKTELTLFLDVLELKSLGFQDPLYCFRCECY